MLADPNYLPKQVLQPAVQIRWKSISWPRQQWLHWCVSGWETYVKRKTPGPANNRDTFSNHWLCPYFKMRLPSSVFAHSRLHRPSVTPLSTHKLGVRRTTWKSQSLMGMSSRTWLLKSILCSRAFYTGRCETKTVCWWGTLCFPWSRSASCFLVGYHGVCQHMFSSCCDYAGWCFEFRVYTQNVIEDPHSTLFC